MGYTTVEGRADRLTPTNDPMRTKKRVLMKKGLDRISGWTNIQKGVSKVIKL
jgi:hypothetical protein